MRSETVDFLGDSVEWLAPHMGTDVAMMLGIAHTLVENGWQDDDFLARCTEGYDTFADYLIGKNDGIAKNAGVIIHIEIEINFHPALVGVTRKGVTHQHPGQHRADDAIDQGGTSSVTALTGSTEEEQFH